MSLTSPAERAPGKRLRIAFDARYTRIGRHDGISRFTANLAAAASKIADVTLVISDERQLQMLPDLPHVRICSPTSWREPWAARSLNSLDADVVFSPMQTIGTFGARHPIVLTIHDLIYYEHPTPPGFLPAPVRLLWRLYHLSFALQRWLLSRADAVVTVSRTTASLLTQHRLTRSAPVVVGNAPQPIFTHMARELAGTPEPDAQSTPSFVYMGSYMPYKGVETLIEAIGLTPGYVLHCVSRVPEKLQPSLRDRAAAAGAQVVFHDGLDDEAYARLLRQSTALVTLSRAEGFGLPLVETMALGVPVVASDIPIFREVAGDAAVYTDPVDPRAAARALETMAQNREAFAAKAQQEAARYTWDASAEGLLDACRQAVLLHRTRRFGRFSRFRR